MELTGHGGNALIISHNAVDRPYAIALETAIHELLDSDTLIDVRYSTSDEAGPQGGEKSREWIHCQVVEAILEVAGRTGAAQEATSDLLAVLGPDSGTAPSHRSMSHQSPSETRP